MITEWERALIVHALANGYNVIVDSTNLNPKHVAALKEWIDTMVMADLTYEEKFFDVPVEECIRRDSRRESPVGEKVIRGMYEKYLAPAPVVYTENHILPHAIIVDIDGTLAKMNGRGPYEWNRVGEDQVNQPVANLVRDIHGVGLIDIILMSGRDGSCRELTEKWLNENFIPYHALFMRPAGNNEKDSIVKKRLFEQHIRGKYYVDFVLDDRDQVVNMWRKELGLTCLQVDYGNF